MHKNAGLYNVIIRKNFCQLCILIYFSFNMTFVFDSNIFVFDWQLEYSLDFAAAAFKFFLYFLTF